MTVKVCSCGKSDQLRRGLCHACYERDRRAGRIESLVPSRESRGHITMLRVNGWRYREIARAAGIDRSLIRCILGGRERIEAKTARGICNVDPATRSEWVRSPWTEERRRTQRHGVWTEERRREQPKKTWATRRANQRRRSYEGLRDDWASRHPVRPVIPKPGEWTRAALCAQIDNEMFFPEKGGSNREPKQVCAECEVKQKCLDFALEHDIEHGIFGGLSVKERKRLKRTRAEEGAITA